uniref:ubiquitinyl hydrolase 1 n=1 Tax=Ciona savignyi TaxID=51511 RepID=H2ZLN2_CIOSA
TGLSNLGNTCFMNSGLQCISNTRPLTKYFLENKHLYELNRTNPLGMKGHIAKRYCDLTQELWSGSSKTVAPLKLRWTISKYAPRFNGFSQHDSQELLAFLLDGLHEDLNRVQTKPYVELKDSDGRPDEEVAQEAWENHLARNQSIIVDLFHGQIRSRVRCLQCSTLSIRFDPFTFLSLPLPMDNSMYLDHIDLKQCLRAFTTEEELGKDELYHCGKCKTMQLAKKKLDIWRLPPTLIIHLKRFQFVNGRWIKSHKVVDFPKTDFDPSSFMTKPSFREESPPLYDLYAVSCHSGILGGGHYIAYAKNKVNNKWYCYNDSSCKEVSADNINVDTAYTLFYERQGIDYGDFMP